MIATVFALEFESSAFRAVQTPQMCVAVWTLGVAGDRSAAALERLIDQCRPEMIILAGFSGALQAGLGVGTIVIGENYTDSRITGLLPVLPNLRVGPIVTVDAILETVSEKRLLGERTGALAADMETAHIHRICQASGIPMVSIRCISDDLTQDMPVPGHVLINPETARPDPSAVFRHLFRHPEKTAGFAKLVSGARTAQRSLGGALQELLPVLLKRRGRRFS